MKHLLIVFMMCCPISLYADDWPREVLSSEGTITMYQPQIEWYSGDSLKARAAVSIIPTGKDEPVFGAIWVTCRVLTDRPTRTVKLEEMEVRRIRFPAGTEGDTAAIAEALEEVIPRSDLTFSLDLLLESIETAQKERENARELEVTPPKIIVMNHPAVLVRIDGNPILTGVEGTSLKRVVNTPYFLVQDPSTGNFFLRGGDIWFSAKQIKGPWRQIATPPNFVAYLSDQMKSDDESYEDSTANDIVSKTGKVPEIVVSTEPTELIATDGPMQLVPIEGTELLYASNTPSRLFLEIKTQKRFILISGRWYTAKSITGPWVFIASDKLPEDFKKIPPGSECDDVLASVAGTIPAKEAIFDAQIPQMAEVDRSEATTQVEYDGDPQFDPIENTGMEYAVNTSTAVIRVNGRYYNCDRGIWFDGASPFGPWEVCIDVPEVIYTIPSRYPVYNVRYVRVYNYTPDVVYVGYTAGYTGCYVYGRTVVYGTGYNYHPWYKQRYYARPWTWGFNVHYDPWTGWSFGGGWGQSRGWFARRANDVQTGWWGPTEYRPIYHPVAKPVYREGYHPVHQQAASSVQAVRAPNDVRRTSGVTRSATLYDNRSAGVKRPVAIEPPRSPREATRTTPTSLRQPESRPTSKPVTPSVPRAEPQPVPRSETPRQPETRPTARPVTPPVSQPEPQPVPRSEIPRQPETRPTARPVTPPVSQPEPQPVPRSDIPRRPATRPTAIPVTPPVLQPEPRPVAVPEPPRIVTRPSTRENNVYAAPNGNIMRSTPQGWQQRDQNSWKKADETPAKQEIVRDSEVRQRAAERSSSPRTEPAPSPAPKRNSDDKERKR
ncbi:MAG: hypothetical protein NTX44_00735 [Ignavibacteriales bacterium]|nr:hypothetical protein [Ignavibacteriales bacterium]